MRIARVRIFRLPFKIEVRSCEFPSVRAFSVQAVVNDTTQFTCVLERLTPEELRQRPVMRDIIQLDVRLSFQLAVQIYVHPLFWIAILFKRTPPMLFEGLHTGRLQLPDKRKSAMFGLWKFHSLNINGLPHEIPGVAAIRLPRETWRAFWLPMVRLPQARVCIARAISLCTERVSSSDTAVAPTERMVDVSAGVGCRETKAPNADIVDGTAN